MVGVHHMQAHALTVRLVTSSTGEIDTPRFPYLCLLVSGGHTLLVLSTSLTDHRILVKTMDLAVGDAIDKCSRALLPERILGSRSAKDSYGKLLEKFVFPPAQYHENETPTYQEYNSSDTSKPRRQITIPLFGDHDPTHRRLMKFSFASFPSQVENILTENVAIFANQEEERRLLGLEVMTKVFRHMADRLILGLEQLEKEGVNIDTLVISGGVAANQFLRYLYVSQYLLSLVTLCYGAYKTNR